MPDLIYNITNHPSERWSAEQREAALKMADGIMDIRFPQVPTDADHDEVCELAEEFLRELDLEKNAPVIVSGEMTMTHTLVSLLQSSGHECYSATTERMTQEKEDGTTTRRYEFVRFREYPNVSRQNTCVGAFLGYSEAYGIAMPVFEDGVFLRYDLIATEESAENHLDRPVIGIGAYTRRLHDGTDIPLPVFVVKER